MLRLTGGRCHLWQWDADQTLAVTREDVTEVHFRNLEGETAMVVDVFEEDGRRLARIPNILLTQARTIDAYAYRTTGGDATVDHLAIAVKARQRPDDYVYTETEVRQWSQLEERIEALERGGGGGTSFTTDETLTLEGGVLSVNTAKAVEEDSSLPITSAAVFAEVGNINALLATI